MSMNAWGRHECLETFLNAVVVSVNVWKCLSMPRYIKECLRKSMHVKRDSRDY